MSFNLFFKYSILSYFIAVTSVDSAVFEDTFDSCSNDEYMCDDGACISIDRLCDYVKDCSDGGDEGSCYSSPVSFLPKQEVLHRSRRQVNRCRRDQWQCRDGTCISFDGKCDGLIDCPDSSDETHALCRKVPCQSNLFRCTYGACVDGTAPCNGIQECADNSDELLPQCRNETIENDGRFKCDDGSVIIAANLCDGTRDCPDGSDETVKACASKTCLPYLFQCAYGACVDQGSDCNNVTECADGSDEADDLCDRNSNFVPVSSSAYGKCILPPYPEHGSYTATNVTNAKPGQRYESVEINIVCNRGYGVFRDPSVICLNGHWKKPIPECIQFCKLNKHPSVEYYCLLTGEVEGRRICNEYEPLTTQVIPECRKPNYYSPKYLPKMTCYEGGWDYVAICEPGLVKQGTNITILVKGNVEIYINPMQYVESVNTVNKPNITESAIEKIDWRIGDTDTDKAAYDVRNDPDIKKAIYDIFHNATTNNKTVNKLNSGTKTNSNNDGKIGFMQKNTLYSYKNSHIRKGVMPSAVFNTNVDSKLHKDVYYSTDTPKTTWKYTMTRPYDRYTLKGAMPSGVFKTNADDTTIGDVGIEKNDAKNNIDDDVFTKTEKDSVINMVYNTHNSPSAVDVNDINSYYDNVTPKAPYNSKSDQVLNNHSSNINIIHGTQPNKLSVSSDFEYKDKDTYKSGDSITSVDTSRIYYPADNRPEYKIKIGDDSEVIIKTVVNPLRDNSNRNSVQINILVDNGITPSDGEIQDAIDKRK